MKNLSLIMNDILQEFFSCIICKNTENKLTYIEPCLHNYCYFCLDSWIINNKKCAECNEYITYIFFGDIKIHINEWDDLKNNIYQMTKNYLERKIVIRKILEERMDKMNENHLFSAELLDPHIPECQKNAIKEQINKNIIDMNSLFEQCKRQEYLEIDELKRSISEENLNDIEAEMRSVFKLLMQQCFVLGKTDINSISLYIIESINDYLKNFSNFILF